MDQSPVTWPAVMALIGAATAILGGFWGFWKAVSASLEKNREASEAGRHRLYEKLDSMMANIRNEFQPKELAKADMKLLQHSIEELNQQNESITRRLDAQCIRSGGCMQPGE